MNNFEDMLEETKESNLLIVLDNLEEKIKISDEIKKEYDDLKLKLKKAMLKVANDNNLDQVKWTTPNNIKITLSKGQPEELEKQIVKDFNIDLLKEKYPSIYEECLEEKEKLVTIKNASNDRLVITMPKD